MITSLADLANEESRLFVSAQDRLGDAFVMASESTCLLSTFIDSVDADRPNFIRCMAMLKNHHTLALLSIARCHHVQAMLNLRQAVEATTNAAYALANPAANYIDATTGLVLKSKKISDRSYKWIDNNYRNYSQDLKSIKDNINDSSSHFNIVHSSRITDDFPDDGFWEAGYFDRHDSHLEKIDLWQLTLVSICAMRLINAVKADHGGVQFTTDFEDRANAIAAKWEALKAVLTSTPRHKAATERAERVAASKNTLRPKPDQTPACSGPAALCIAPHTPPPASK